MNFGQRLKELREEKELTQEDLGKIINVSKPSISRYEAGTNEPNNDTLKQLAEYFDVSVDYLLCRTDNPNTIALEGDQIPVELRNENVELIEVIKDAKDSGLTPAEIKEVLEFAKKIKKK